jgi:hypothetical protein
MLNTPLTVPVLLRPQAGHHSLEPLCQQRQQRTQAIGPQ